MCVFCVVGGEQEIKIKIQFSVPIWDMFFFHGCKANVNKIVHENDIPGSPIGAQHSMYF